MTAWVRSLPVSGNLLTVVMTPSITSIVGIGSFNAWAISPNAANRYRTVTLKVTGRF